MSYRNTNGSKYPWTLVCDRENLWTADFDNIIILEHPAKSYMDKLTLFGLVPYDECIFIDADCLVFSKLDSFWDRMDQVEGFSCFGKPLPLDSQDGWFLIDDVGEWKQHISFIPQMHGGICFLKKGEKLNRILYLAHQIEENYNNYKFKYFDKPADEPILALATAITMSRPIAAQEHDFLFLPSVSVREQRNVILSNCASFVTGKSAGAIRIIHYQNHNTEKTGYQVSRDILLYEKRNIHLRYVFYSLADALRQFRRHLKRLWEKIKK